MKNKPIVFLAFILVVTVAIAGCEVGAGGVGNYVAESAKPQTGTSTSDTGACVTASSSSTVASADTGTAESGWEEEEEEPDEPPMDTSTLTWYYKGVKVGDWVKYLTPRQIEVWEVKKISGSKMTLEKRFYDSDGNEKKWEGPANLIGEDERTKEDMKDAKSEKKNKYEQVDMDILGTKMKLDIICSRDRNAQVANVDAFSFSVPVGGKVFATRNEEVAYMVLAFGDTKNRDEAIVEAGDFDKAKSYYDEPVDALVAGYSNVIEQVLKDLRQWDKPGGTWDDKPEIADKETPLVPISEAAKKKADSLDCNMKGIRPGNWGKVLAVQDHIQVWLVTEVTDNGYTFFRRFYNNKGVLVNIENASEDFASMETINNNRENNIDGTYDIENLSFTLPATGDVYKCTQYDRAASDKTNRNWYIKEFHINDGRVFSQFGSKVWVFIIDFGDEPDAERMKVKKGDVRRAKVELNKVAPGKADPYHKQIVDKWKAELQIYLDILNGVLKRAGMKEKKISRDYDLVDIDYVEEDIGGRAVEDEEPAPEEKTDPEEKPAPEEKTEPDKPRGELEPSGKAETGGFKGTSSDDEPDETPEPEGDAPEPEKKPGEGE